MVLTDLDGNNTDTYASFSLSNTDASRDDALGDGSAVQSGEEKGNVAVMRYFRMRCTEETAKITKDLPWIQHVSGIGCPLCVYYA